MQKGRIHIGTSGWHYPHWVGPFYPEDMPAEAFLRWYARHFQTVEINNTFYQLPARQTVLDWRARTPPDFLFACKASRFITHMKKLTDPKRSTAKFFQTIDALGRKLGPILFQLPPRWRVNPSRLTTFLASLPAGYRYAFECRDPSWFTPAVYDALAAHNAAFCIFELAGLRSPLELTADWVYVRLHGPGGAYQGRYGARGLASWARRCRTWLKTGMDVYVYFDNDQAGYAVSDARTLQQMLRKGPVKRR